jgi:hypothetical protein
MAGGDDTAVVACPYCARSAGLLAWRINGLVPTCFALVFWNWPRVADAFIDAISQLADSEIITFHGKL